ncbi:MAG: pyruvate dehydrogenase complex dihydrolipoamide acetyltransferase [Alphaproteobacteria bacterium]|nr:pyruvate dehydrogenase complex dihydrolipoamide acetyltransferase [Alphaproteobacteria bacterium]
MPIIITMPALSPTMTEGTLAKWIMKEGDAVRSGDMLAEIETDKATMEVEAIDEGVLAKILVPEGTEGVAVNAPIAVLLEDGEDASDIQEAVNAASVGLAPAVEVTAPADTNLAPAPHAPVTPEATPAPPADGGSRILASPLAKRMVTQAGLDLALILGSGPRGRIVKSDIEAVIAAGGTQASAAAPTPKAAVPAPVPAAVPVAPGDQFELEKLSSMRKVIARRMTESKQQAPHFYLTVDCELDALLSLRKELNDKADGTYKLSINDLVIKAAAVALMKVPDANVGYSEDGIRRYKNADISVAVATDKGLITPIIRNANGKGLVAISIEMKELAQKANDGKLMPEEYQGGSFSISNLGMFGVKQFDAVINMPQGCILAVGAGEQRPVVKDGALAIATVMSVTISVDHRAVDGAVGAQFLAAFKSLIQDPMTMLL